MTRGTRFVYRSKRRLTLAGVLIVALATSLTAVASWTTSGTGAGSASNGTLTAPGKPNVPTTGATVNLSWSAATVSGGGTVNYHVERRPDPGATWTDVCGSTDAAPISSTSCNDTPGNGTFVYRATARYASWRTTGPESDPVTAAVTATKLVFTTSPRTFTAGTTSGTITVERQNASNTPATAGATTVNLSSSSGAGVFRDTADTTTISSVTISPGSSSASLKYTDTTAGTPTITAADNAAVLTSATQQETVNPATATSLTVSGYPASTVAGVSNAFSVTAKDAFGNTATGYAGTVHFTNTNDAQAVLPANSTLTAGTASFGATFKTVAGGTKTLTATDTVTGTITGSQTAITVTPAAAASLTVAGYPASTVAGVSNAFSVTAKDTFGNTATGYAGTVHFTNTNDAQAVLPANSTLTAGTGSFSATFKTVAGGNKTLTATDTVTGTITGSQTGITVTPASAASLTVSGYPASTVAGVAHSFTVTAKDAFGNTDTNYAGTVHFSNTNDAQAVLPANSTLTAGTGSFNATFKTVAGGNKTLTATDTVTGTITGSQTGITVTPASAASLSVSGYPASTVAGVAHSFTVTAKDAFGNTDTNYAGTVHFSNTNDAQAVLPANSTLTAGTGSFNATFKTVAGGNKTLTATDTVTGTITGSQSGITVTPDTASNLVFSTQPGSATAGSAFGTQPVVKTQDAFGNNSTVALGTTRTVTVAIASGTGPLQGTATLDIGTAAGNGTVTFTNLRIDTAGAKTLSATAAAGSPTLASTTSNSFTVNPATASTLAFTTQPGSATAGSAFGTQPVVKTQDAFGNNSTVALGTTRTVTVAIASGTGPLQGTATLDIGTAAGNGTVTFTNLRIDTAGAKTLSATAAAGSPTLAAATSNAFTVTGGAATTIAKTAGDPQSAPISNAFATALKVTVTDAFSNPVQGATVTFTAPATGASGTFANATVTTTATTAADGTASASTLTANGTAGTYNVAASATGTNTVNFSLTNYGPWTWVANGTAKAIANGTTTGINYPTGTAAGDLLLLAVVQPGNISTVPTASGWTSLGTMKMGSTIRVTVFWRAAGAETSASVTAGDAGSAWVVRYARSGGFGPAPAPAATATTGGSNNGTTLTPPDVTTTDVNATAVSVVGTTAANTLTLSTANSFILRAALTTTSPAAAFGLADRFVAATVLVNAPTWQSNASTGWAAVTGAFK